MRDYIPYLIFGLTAGSVYGISAMGLVLTYKTSGLFNFGHGATSAVGAYAFYALRQSHGLPWPVAAVIAVGVLGPFAGLVLERLNVLLADVTTTFKIVATVGLLVAIQSAVGVIYGDQSTFTFTPFLPQSTAVTIDAVQVSWDNVIDLSLGIVLAVGLYLLFSRSRLGIEMRGVVDDAALLDMSGTAPDRIRRRAWMIGSTFAAASGVLFASTQQQLDIAVLSLLVVQAFGAAAIGRFTSLPLAFVGGIGVGLLQKVLSKVFSGHDNLQGLDLQVPFVVLFVTLLVVKRGKLVEVGRSIKQRPTAASALPASVRRVGYGTVFVIALLVPHLGFVGTHLPAYNTAAAQAALFISLSLLVRTSGQISLCHIAFAAIGAAGFGHFLNDGIPWAVALLLSALVVVPVAAFIAIPAIRLSGLYLALATLGFGILVAQYAYGKSYMFGFGHLATRRPAIWGLDRSDERYYYLLLVFGIVSLGIVLLIERSRLGRLLRALADSPTALSTLGLSLSVSRTLVFCISGFLAGLSGALYGSLFGSVNQDSFNYVQSLVLLAVMSISGRRTVTVAIVGPVLLDVAPNYITSSTASYMLQLGFGIFAIVAAALSQGRLGTSIGAWSAATDPRTESTTDDRVDASGPHVRDVDRTRGVGGLGLRELTEERMKQRTHTFGRRKTNDPFDAAWETAP